MFADYFWINGRNNRMTWWLIAFSQILVFAYYYGPVYIRILGGDANAASSALNDIGIVGALANIAFGWVSFCNSIRRYHDRDKSGWWILMGVVPLIGFIWQIIELGFLAGTPGDNHYGPMPGAKKRAADTDSEIDGLQSRTNSLAKVDDNYLAEYARKYASSQATAPTSPFPLAVKGGTFGKRR